MDPIQNYTGYVRSRFSIHASAEQEKKIKDFIAAHKLPKSFYYELRMREMDKRMMQTKALEETLGRMLHLRSKIVEWDLATHLKPISNALKIYTKSEGAVNYIVEKIKKTHLLVIMKNHLCPLNEHFKISLMACISTYAAGKKEIVVTTNLNNDTRFPLGNGWPSNSNNVEIGLAAPVMSSNKKVMAVMEWTKVIHSTEYSFIDIEAVALLTSLIGYLAEESKRMKDIQMSLTFINPMMKLITRYLECTLPVASLISQLTYMNKNELGAVGCSFSVMRYIRERKININYIEDPKSHHCHIENIRISSEKDESFLGHTMKEARIMKQKDKDSGRWLFGVPIAFTEVTGALQFQFIAPHEPYIKKTNQKLLKITCVFLGFILELNELNDILIKNEKEILLIQDMLNLQTLPCIHDMELLQSCTPLFKTPEGILEYSWAPEVHLSEYSKLQILKNLLQSRLQHLFKDDFTLNKFILFIKRIHSENEETFYRHILVTTHFINVFLANNEDYFSPTERDALLLTALCHRIYRCKVYEYSSRRSVGEPIFKMYGLSNDQSYTEELLDKISRWKFFFPCNFEKDMVDTIQKKYHKFLHYLKSQTFDESKRSHRDLVVYAIAINADKCMYFKKETFLIYFDENCPEWDTGNFPQNKNWKNELTKLWKPISMSHEDFGQHHSRKLLAISLINNFLQPWLKILKILFPDAENLQEPLDKNLQILEKYEMDMKEEKASRFSIADFKKKKA